MDFDQDALARKVGVSQQTVSRWESGRTTPNIRRRSLLAEALNVDKKELEDAVAQDRLSRIEATVSLPVRPLSTELPFADLPWPRFEELVEAVAAARHREHNVSRIGGPGDKQYGFDVVVKYKSKSGYPFGYQVRRVKTFGPAAVRATINEATLSVENGLIVISKSVATSQALVEVHKDPTWDLWDGRRLSREVRTLEAEDRLRIVETYFPNHVEEFLGISAPSPWQTPDEFFAPLTVDRLLSHELPLVGRSTLLDQLVTFVSDDAAEVGLLIGRGGTGKSRLLLEVGRRASADGITVRFLKSRTGVDASQFALLPKDGQLFVVIDDCHDRDDVMNVVEGVRRSVPQSRILLALRTYGTGAIRAQLSRLQLLSEDLPTFPITDLSKSEAATLAQHALGDGDPASPSHMATVIGGYTFDAPYLTVVAARSLRRGLVHSLDLASEETFRDHVIQLFADAELKGVADLTDPVRREVLVAVSALQPYHISDSSFQDALAKMVGRAYDQVHPVIVSLENAGVLLRRGDALRVVPDLLGDAILTTAAADTRAGTPTGYVDRLWKVCGERARRNLLVNACRAEVHAGQPGGRRTSLTEFIWTEVKTQAAKLDLAGRLDLLQLLEKVAYFAPQETLHVVEQLLAIPAVPIPSSEWSAIASAPTSVRHAVPTVLRNAAYNEEVLPQVIELLWQLAQDDGRDVDRTPGHPLRILQWLAGIAPEKPIGYSAEVLIHAERWLENQGGGNAPSPFDVIDTILATQGTVDTYDGKSVTLHQFLVKVSAVRQLRERVVKSAISELMCVDLGRAGRACRTLDSSLRFPAISQDPEMRDREREPWLPVFLGTLNQIRTAVSASELNPTVAVALRRALLWHLEYSRTETSDAAHCIVEQLGDDVGVRLAEALFDGWGHLERGKTGDFNTDDGEKRRQIEELTEDLLEAFDVNTLLALIELRIQEQLTVFGRLYGPNTLLFSLTRREGDFGTNLIEHVVLDPDSVLDESVPSVLVALFECDEQAATTLSSRLASSALPRHRTFAALTLGTYRGRRELSGTGEREVLVQLATDIDPNVRLALAQGLGRLKDVDSSIAHHILSLIPFEDSNDVAEEIVGALSPSSPLVWEQLALPERRRILDQLELCPSLNGYELGQFMSMLANTNVGNLARLLMRRIERAEASSSEFPYDPIPYEWQTSLVARRDASFETTLHEVLGWMARGTDSYLRMTEGGRLFGSLAGEFDEPVRSVILSWLGVRTEVTVQVMSRAIVGFPASAVFNNVGFVAELLRAAETFGAKDLAKIESSLQASVSMGRGLSGLGGFASNDLELERRSREVSSGLVEGSLEKKFFDGLADSAHRRAHWFDSAEPTELDHHDWDDA